MPKPRYPNLRHERNRHGNYVWYYREDDGPRLRVKGDFDTPEFKASYREAQLAYREPVKKAATRDPKTLGWLLHEYRKSTEWGKLSQATRKQRDALFAGLGLALEEPFEEIERDHIEAGLQRREKTPFAANNWLKALRSVFKWAVRAKYVKTDPTVGVESLRTKTDGFHAWTESEVRRFEERWPIGTREQLALAVLLHTGLRRGDALRLGEGNRAGNFFSIRTEKTGQKVILPVLPILRRALESAPRGNRTYLAQLNGEPWNVFSFGNWFREACDAAGVPGSAHGLRKLAATRLWEAGVSEAQLDAAMGWTTGSGMSRIYAKKANRERLSKEAFEKLLGAALADEKDNDDNEPL